MPHAQYLQHFYTASELFSLNILSVSALLIRFKSNEWCFYTWVSSRNTDVHSPSIIVELWNKNENIFQMQTERNEPASKLSYFKLNLCIFKL
jgi:hypothetical protein